MYLIVKCTDSGHSDQIDQEKGSKIQERDFKDEAIVPEDAYVDEELSYIKEKMILDDVRPSSLQASGQAADFHPQVLFDIFFQHLPPGSNFVVRCFACSPFQVSERSQLGNHGHLPFRHHAWLVALPEPSRCWPITSPTTRSSTRHV